MMSLKLLLALLQAAALVGAWLPSDKNLFSWQHAADGSIAGSHDSATHDNRVPSKQRRATAKQKIRGVNAGSHLVMEPWMASSEWSSMGCGGFQAEANCVAALGQSRANAAFSKHWDTWITQEDVKTMGSYGLNTIRVPVGFWINEILVGKNETFPQGGLVYLERLCGWAAAAQMYVILDLHGLPGAQKAQAPFTGQYASTADFYEDSNYGRATQFLTWLTNLIHTNPSFSTVGMVEVANEPTPGHDSLLNAYYPSALQAVRQQEDHLGVSAAERLSVQFMDRVWGVGDPSTVLQGNSSGLAYDNHHYIYAKPWVAATRAAYIASSCSAAAESDNSPLVVGEWSLAVSEGSSTEFSPSSAGAQDFYRTWWAAQVTTFEMHEGWVFWSWKTDLQDYRWDYQRAVAAGIIPTDPAQAYKLSPCGAAANSSGGASS